MDISRDELKVALERGLESGWTDANSLTGYVMGWQSMKALLDEKAEAVADAPEDPTPKRGDVVRVKAGLVDHEYCAGRTGELEGPDVGGDYYAGGHYGALSDFEKIT